MSEKLFRPQRDSVRCATIGVHPTVLLNQTANEQRKQLKYLIWFSLSDSLNGDQTSSVTFFKTQRTETDQLFLKESEIIVTFFVQKSEDSEQSNSPLAKPVSSLVRESSPE